MAQQQLHRAQIGAMVEQVGGKCVAQSVRRQGRMDASEQRIFFHQHPKHHPRHGAARNGSAGGHK